jgi:hypothetical protein
MMRVIFKMWLMLAAVVLACGGAGAASFTAALDRDSMVLGESANLSLSFEGGQPRNVPEIDVPGLDFTQTGTSQSVNIVNSEMSTTVTVNFTVTARQAGNFTIPALTANVNGQQLSAAPLKITVTRASAPSTADMNSGNEVAFMKLSMPQTRFYVGQPVVAQLQIYLRDDVQNLIGFQLNNLNMDGFNPGKTVDLLNDRHRAQVGNRVYNVIPLALPLTPLKSGRFALGPFTATAAIVVASQDQGGDPFIRSFFNQGQQKQVTLATEPVNVESLPLPDAGKPADFTGAIGDFTMSASVGPTNLTVGDPITVHVQISGTGLLGGVTLPFQSTWQNFKTYPPTSKTDTTDPYGFQGTKTFEQIISPENADVHEVPPFSFSFFNPDDARYHTLTQAAVSLKVQAAGATPMPILAVNKTATPESQTPQDILPLRENLGTAQTIGTPLVARPAFLALQSIPLIAFVAAFVWRKRTDSLANNPRLRRRRAVAQLISGGLADLKKFAAENKSDEFFALLFRLMQEQLGERLDCPATAITGPAVDGRLARLGAAPATLESLDELFQLCDQARYAPVRGTSELNSLAERFEKVVSELQALKT